MIRFRDNIATSSFTIRLIQEGYNHNLGCDIKLNNSDLTVPWSVIMESGIRHGDCCGNLV